MESAIISDPLRSMITVTRQGDGRIVVRAANRIMLFSEAEIERLYAFAGNKAMMQRYPVESPRRLTAEHSAQHIAPKD